MRCDMSDSKKEGDTSPLYELRIFCLKNKKKWWFVLFFPSDLANELTNFDSKKSSIYEKYSFRRSWLGILQSLNFFSDPKILERMDEETKKQDGNIFSGFEIAETEQNGDVQESAQKIVTTSDLKGLKQTKSQDTIASSLSKEDTDILNFLNEPLNGSLKASIQNLTKESKDKLSTIIQMKGMYSKNLIRQIINKKRDNGTHDDRLLILFYYLVENKQIFFPLDPRIENALSMLSEGSLQAYNQAIKDEKDSNVSVVTNGIDYAKIKVLFANTRRRDSKMDVEDFLSKIKEISQSNQMIIYNIMTLYPKINRSSLDKLLSNEKLLSEYGNFSQKLNSDYKTQINNDDKIRLIKYMLMFNDIKSIESIYNSLNHTSIFSFVKSHLFGVNTIQIINYLLKELVSPNELHLVSLLLDKLPMTEANIKNLKNFLNEFNSDKAMLTKLKQSPVEILNFFSDKHTRDYFIHYKDKICLEKSVIGELYETVKNLKSLGFSIQQIDEISKDLTSENKDSFIYKVRSLKQCNYYPINFNKDEIQGLLTIDSNNFKAFMSSINSIEFLGGNAVSMLAPSGGNNTRWKSNALIFEIFKKLDLSKDACYELLSLSSFHEKTEEELTKLDASLQSVIPEHRNSIKKLLEGEEKETLFIQNITELLMCKSKEDMDSRYSSIKDNILSFDKILDDFSSKIPDLEFNSIRKNKKYSTRWNDVYNCLLLLDKADLMKGLSDKYLNKLLYLDSLSFNRLKDLVKHQTSYSNLMEQFLKYEDMKYAFLFFEQISSIDKSTADQKIDLFNKISDLSPEQQGNLMFCLKILDLPCNKELFTLENISMAVSSIQEGTDLSKFKDCDKLISGAEILTEEDFYHMFVPDPGLNQMPSKYTTKTTLKKPAEVTGCVVSVAMDAIGKLEGAVYSAGAALVSDKIPRTAMQIVSIWSFYHQPDTSNNKQSSASENHLPGSPNTVASPPSPNKGNQ